MEEILNKNIFDDRDLFKLSPDYSPSDILLRMQLRRKMSFCEYLFRNSHGQPCNIRNDIVYDDNIVKDSHSHGVSKNTSPQRKSIKKSKDISYNMNKEIVKIRNEFRNLNLKNQVLLKNSKNIDSFKCKDVGDILISEIKTWDDDIDFNCEFCEEDLIIQNDADFKLKDKPKPAKSQKEIKKIETVGIKTPKNIDNNQNCDLLRVQCRQISKSPLQLENDSQIPIEEVNTIPKEENDHNIKFEDDSQICRGYRIQKPYNLNDSHVSDLQNLLVMMAISSKPDDEKEDNYTYDNNTNESNTRRLGTDSSEATNINDILNVSAMRIVISDKQIKLMTKYVEKWKIFVIKKRQQREQQRKETINRFFEKLEKKKLSSQTQDGNAKAKLLVRDYNTYQHRYKVQKHIIALQKAKLEQQNRMIEELKYNKIVETSRQSVDAMKEEVKRTYYEIDRQLKPKIKCLTNELKIHEIEEQSLVLHCLKVPQFLKRMEKRAREREEKHAMIRERRRQMEEERIRLKEQAELAKSEMDKEEKLKRLEELREKRKREKIDNIRKKQHAERLRALIVIADLHYEKTLMSKYGIRPLKMLLEIKHDNMEKAKAHYKFQIMKNVFLHWMWHTEDMWYERNFKADDFNRKRILGRAFQGLKLNRHEYVLKRQVAEDYYDLYVTQLVFRKLREAMEIIRKENEVKWETATAYCNSNLLFRTFTCWRTLPALNALKREQEVRKAKWRQKVLQVVPDYTPPED